MKEPLERITTDPLLTACVVVAIRPLEATGRPSTGSGAKESHPKAATAAKARKPATATREVLTELLLAPENLDDAFGGQ